MAVKLSSAWQSTSKPEYAATRSGMCSVCSGSTSPSSGLHQGRGSGHSCDIRVMNKCVMLNSATYLVFTYYTYYFALNDNIWQCNDKLRIWAANGSLRWDQFPHRLTRDERHVEECGVIITWRCTLFFSPGGEVGEPKMLWSIFYFFQLL